MAPGRKRKPGKRYACGKRTRQEMERDAISVAIDARRRHFGVTAKQAKDERLGSALGRLAFRELIRSGSGNLNRVDKWTFRATAA